MRYHTTYSTYDVHICHFHISLGAQPGGTSWSLNFHSCVSDTKLSFVLQELKWGWKLSSIKFSKSSFEIVFRESLSSSSRIMQLFLADLKVWPDNMKLTSSDALSGVSHTITLLGCHSFSSWLRMCIEQNELEHLLLWVLHGNSFLCSRLKCFAHRSWSDIER